MLSLENRSKVAHGALLLLAVFMGSLIVVGSARAEPLTLAAAINKAGRQRMLSQRMVKAYCQAGLDVRADEAAKQLREAVAQFDSQLAELKASTPNLEVTAGLEIEETNWKPVREIVTKPYTREGVPSLAEKSEMLLKSSNSVVLMLERASGKPVARLVNLSGRQRMLSQRIAKLYMLRELGIKDASVTDGLKQAGKEFKEAHETLKHAPGNTEDINKLLKLADIQWQLLEYSMGNDKAALAEFVATTTDKILNTMDLVTERYASQ